MRASHDATVIPEGIYRDKIVTARGQHDRLNLRKNMLTPLVSAVRLLCVEKGIGAVSTNGRIEALSSAGVLDKEEAENLQVIYPWLVEICLQRALQDGKPLDWILDVHECTPEERRLLSESFRVVKETVKKAS
jgi:signal-transduction protein with cAMP-binding, CBS, and nucleotidyltransferase domain